MTDITAPLGIGACSLGIGALYFNIQRPIFASIWTAVGVGWFVVAGLRRRRQRRPRGQR